MKLYFKNMKFLFGFILIIFILFLIIIGLFLNTYYTNNINCENILLKPSLKHLFGTDNLGRDIFIRIVVSSKIVFIICFLSTLISMVLGVFLGSFMGYYEKIIDYIGNKIIDTLIIFPKILLALVILSIFGNGILETIFTLSLISTPRFLKLMRVSFLQSKDLDYVRLSKVKGINNFRIMFFHILPNFKIQIIVNFVLTFSSNILSETGLSYLGLGVEPNISTWGRMLNESQMFFKEAPWYTFSTGIMIFLLVLGSNLLGDGINEVSYER